MTKEERNNKLKYLITCMKCEVDGTGGFKHDTLVDIVGYAACAEELMTNEIKNEQR